MIIKDDNIYIEISEKLNYSKTKLSVAPDWFFILTTGRTGSTILTRLLNLHPDICCANEQNMLPLFSTILNSKFYVKRKPRLRYSFENQNKVGLAGLRVLMEAWKATQTSKKFFGDKDMSYGGDFSGLIDDVFPKNKKILSTRNLLDQLSSLYHQVWYTKLPNDASERFIHIKNDVVEKTNYLIKWSSRCDLIVPFESFTNRDGAELMITKILETIGANPKSYPMGEAVELCVHKNSLGRWKKDEIILDFIGKLKINDPKLYEELMITAV